MAIVTVETLRSRLGLVPNSISDEELTGAIDEVNKDFYTKHRPIVDWDYDGEIKDDVTVKVDGSLATIESVDAAKGKITLTEAPTSGTATGSYYWSPLSDDELTEVIDSAQTEAENESAMDFEAADATYKETLLFGNEITLPHYPINSIAEVKVEGVALDTEDYEHDDENGIITLLDYEAGVPVRPYFEPTTYDVEVSYNHGWATPPGNVVRFVLLRAMQEALTTLNSKLAITEETDDRWVLEFSEETVNERIDKLKEMADRLKETLPKQVSIV